MAPFGVAGRSPGALPGSPDTEGSRSFSYLAPNPRPATAPGRHRWGSAAAPLGEHSGPGPPNAALAHSLRRGTGTTPTPAPAPLLPHLLRPQQRDPTGGGGGAPHAARGSARLGAARLGAGPAAGAGRGGRPGRPSLMRAAPGARGLAARCAAPPSGSSLRPLAARGRRGGSRRCSPKPPRRHCPPSAARPSPRLSRSETGNADTAAAGLGGVHGEAEGCRVRGKVGAAGK